VKSPKRAWSSNMKVIVSDQTSIAASGPLQKLVSCTAPIAS